jgi:hypothetical protein
MLVYALEVGQFTRYVHYLFAYIGRSVPIIPMTIGFRLFVEPIGAQFFTMLLI